MLESLLFLSETHARLLCIRGGIDGETYSAITNLVVVCVSNSEASAGSTTKEGHSPDSSSVIDQMRNLSESEQETTDPGITS